MLRENLGRTAEVEVRRFFEATLFNWVALGTDAHAKNYALVHPRIRLERANLAPLYDLGTALAYPEINNRRTKLAMAYAGHYRTFEIEPRHVVREAESVGIAADWAIERARYIVDGLPAALSHAAAEAHLDDTDARFAGSLVDLARERTVELRRQLHSWTASR